MTLTIEISSTPEYNLNVTDLEEGHIYKCTNGTIYICNPVGDIIAFSVCGKRIVYKSTSVNFIEINATLTIHD